jgi:hypothetical protein
MELSDKTSQLRAPAICHLFRLRQCTHRRQNEGYSEKLGSKRYPTDWSSREAVSFLGFLTCTHSPRARSRRSWASTMQRQIMIKCDHSHKLLCTLTSRFTSSIKFFPVNRSSPLHFSLAFLFSNFDRGSVIALYKIALPALSFYITAF